MDWLDTVTIIVILGCIIGLVWVTVDDIKLGQSFCEKRSLGHYHSGFINSDPKCVLIKDGVRHEYIISYEELRG